MWLSSIYEGRVHDKKFCDEDFHFPRISGFGKIDVSSEKDQMALSMPRRNLKGKSLPLLKNKRTSEFPESGLKWNMP